MISHRAYATTRFGVRFFISIQGLNGEDCGFEVLVSRGTCMKTSQLSSRRSSWHGYESGNSGESAAPSGDGSGRSVVHGPRCNFTMFETLLYFW